MKAVCRQARLELSGGPTPDLLRPWTWISLWEKTKTYKRKYGFGLFVGHNLLNFWVPTPPPPPSGHHGHEACTRGAPLLRAPWPCGATPR